MTSIVAKSFVLLRTYPGINRKLILHDVRNSRAAIARCISQTKLNLSKDEDNKTTSTAVDLYAFARVKSKEKETYLEVLRMYINRDIYRRGHVEFIYAAMKHMEEFGVDKDLEVYKSLLNVLPKGKFIPTNLIQAEFMHYPKQQQCAIDLLEQMEDNWVVPDEETEIILLNIFGKTGYPLRKYWRMMYWMPKFKNASPWALPEILPDDSLELAKLAIERITSVDVRSKVTVFQSKDLEDSIDKTWVVSGTSPDQQELMIKHPPDVPIYVEGPFRIWLRNVAINYFILRAEPVERPKPPPVDIDDVSDIKLPFWDTERSSAVAVETTVHEQEDGTILAVCATGTSSRDSLLSWIRSLEKENSALAKIPVLFTLKSPLGAVTVAQDKSNASENPEGDKKIDNK